MQGKDFNILAMRDLGEKFLPLSRLHPFGFLEDVLQSHSKSQSHLFLSLPTINISRLFSDRLSIDLRVAIAI